MLKGGGARQTLAGQQARADFTDYVRDLEPDGQPRSREAFDRMWSALRRALISELKKRALWGLSPGCLGIYGGSSWAEDEVLDELLADCYLFVFSRRLRGLKAQLEVKANIDGLIFRSIRNFLHETQKRHDPLGFRVFEVLRAATRSAIRGGALHVVGGTRAVGNDTVLAFDPASDPEEASGVDLDGHVVVWDNDLLPDLVTARGDDVEAVQARLEAKLLKLQDAGVAVFRFKDLVGALKDDVRGRWRAVWMSSEGEMAYEDGDSGALTLVSLAAPGQNLEERETFRALLACMEKSIAALAERKKTKSYLQRLWVFVSNHAAEDGDGGCSPAPVGAESIPSHRQLARLLAIPRDRLSGLFAILRRLFEDCQAAVRGT